MPSQGLDEEKNHGRVCITDKLVDNRWIEEGRRTPLRMSILLLGAIIEVHDKFQKKEVDKVLR